MGFFKKLNNVLKDLFLSDLEQPAKKKKAAKKTPKAKRRPAKVKAKKAPPKLKKKTPKRTPKVVKAKRIPGKLIGQVTHFFPQVNAAAVTIDSGTLKVGNELYFKGATTDFKMKVKSMQINRLPVTAAGKGAEVGIEVKKRVRQGDEVYQLS